MSLLLVVQSSYAASSTVWSGGVKGLPNTWIKLLLEPALLQACVGS